MRERGMRLSSPENASHTRRSDVVHSSNPVAAQPVGGSLRGRSPPVREAVRVNGSVPSVSAALPTSAVTRPTRRALSRASSRGRSASPAARSASYRRVIQETKEKQTALRPKKAWGPPPGTISKKPIRKPSTVGVASTSVAKTTKELTRFTERTLSEAVRRGKLDAVTELAEFVEQFNRKIQSVLDGDRPSPVPSPRSRSRPINRPISSENSVPLPTSRPPSRNPSPALKQPRPAPKQQRNQSPGARPKTRSNNTNSSNSNCKTEVRTERTSINCNKEASKERPDWGKTVTQANQYLKERREKRAAKKAAVQVKARTWFE